MVVFEKPHTRRVVPQDIRSSATRLRHAWSIRGVARLLSAIILVVPHGHALAQTAGSSSAGGASSFQAGAGATPLSQFDSSTGTQTDILFGRNATGPYLLTWKKFREGSDSVIRNGRALTRDTDYTIDVNAGTVTFTAALATNEVARVSYPAVTTDAVLNVAGNITPIEWDVWQSQKSHLALAAVITSDPSASGSQSSVQSAKALLEYAGGTQLGRNSDLTSALYLGLGNDPFRTGGIRLVESSKFRMGAFGITYAMAGTDFEGGKSTNLTPGRELLESTTKLSPLRDITVEGLFRQTNIFADTSKGITSSFLQELNATITDTLPKKAGSLVAKVSQSETSAPGIATSTVLQDSLQVQRNLGSKTTATLGYVATTSTTAGTPAAATYAQQANAAIQSKVNDKLTVNASIANSLGTAGVVDTGALSVVATPVKQQPKLKITANLQDRYQSDGAYTNHGVIVELPPLPYLRTTISGGLRETVAPGRAELAQVLDAMTHPFRYLELTTGIRLRDALAAPSDTEAVDTYSIKMALAPVRRFKLTGSVINNPEDGTGTITHSYANALGLETDLGSMSLRGQYGINKEYLIDRLSNTLDFGIDLKFTRADILSTTYQTKYTIYGDATSTETYKLLFTHHFSLFEMSLGETMTLNRLNNAILRDESDLKTEAKLAVRF